MKIIKPITLCLFICTLTVFLCSPQTVLAQTSQDQAASVIAVRGGVKISSADNALRTLKVKDPIFKDDTIDTGKRGRIQIMFTDNTIISLGRKSVMKVSDYQLKKDNSGKLNTKVTEGVFRVMGGILTKNSPGNFKTETPSGTIGIRGSMYTGRVSGQELSLVFEGGRGITLQNRTGMVLISKPGNGTKSMGMDQPIMKPYKFTGKDLGAMHSGLASRTTGSGAGGAALAGRQLQVPVQFSAAGLSQPAGDAAPQGKQAGPEEGGGPKDEGPKTDEAAEAEILKLTDQVKGNPADAAIILKQAINDQGLSVDAALGAVLMGMQNTNRKNFEQVLKEAMDMGMSVDDAKGIVDKLKASGGLCK